MSLAVDNSPGRRIIRPRLRTTLLIVLVAGVSVALVATTATAAGASPVRPAAAAASTQIYNIINVLSRQCVDVKDYGTSNLDKVQQWPCHYPKTQNQLWNVDVVGVADFKGTTYEIDQIKEKGTNECLEVLNWRVSNGSDVDIYNCAPVEQMHGNQLWLVERGSHRIGNYGASIDRGSFIALDVVCTKETKYGKQPGTKIQIWQEDPGNSCAGYNQKWVLE